MNLANAVELRPMPLFEAGRILALPGVLALFGLKQPTLGVFIARHITGDWGDEDEDMTVHNDAALREGRRLISVYAFKGTKFWVVTEADRSRTVALLPEEYNNGGSA